MTFRERIRSWQIVKHTKLWFSISLAIILIGIGAMVFNQVTIGSPFNLGIDFQGGTVISVTCTKQPDAVKIKEILAKDGYKDAIVQEAQGNKVSIKLNAKTITPDDVQKIIGQISQEVAPVDKDATGVTSIAPVIGKELEKSGAIALALALLFILFYITVRFTFQFALATVLALFHDILVTLGMLALFRVELNAPFIGAFLTIMTYSVEDSVVVMDRIRENLRFRTKESFPDLVNRSITEVWVRSMNTSITTFLASFSLVLFGGPTLRDFSMTLMFGLLSGTYSSIYIASPLLVLWHHKEKGSRGERKAVATVQPKNVGNLQVETASGGAPAQEVKPPLKKKTSKKSKKKRSNRKRK
jgi:preprotein translocase subunit SecF